MSERQALRRCNDFVRFGHLNIQASINDPERWPLPGNLYQLINTRAGEFMTGGQFEAWAFQHPTTGTLSYCNVPTDGNNSGCDNQGRAARLYFDLCVVPEVNGANNDEAGAA